MPENPSTESKDTESPISLIDMLLMGFGLFLIYMSYGSYVEGDMLGAGADFLLGVAGVLMGLRNPIQHSLQKPVPMLNTAAIVAAIAGIMLFGATFFQ